MPTLSIMAFCSLNTDATSFPSSGGPHVRSVLGMVLRARSRVAQRTCNWPAHCLAGVLELFELLLQNHTEGHDRGHRHRRCLGAWDHRALDQIQTSHSARSELTCRLRCRASSRENPETTLDGRAQDLRRGVSGLRTVVAAVIRCRHLRLITWRSEAVGRVGRHHRLPIPVGHWRALQRHKFQV